MSDSGSSLPLSVVRARRSGRLSQLESLTECARFKVPDHIRAVLPPGTERDLLRGLRAIHKLAIAAMLSGEDSAWPAPSERFKSCIACEDWAGMAKAALALERIARTAGGKRAAGERTKDRARVLIGADTDITRTAAARAISNEVGFDERQLRRTLKPLFPE